MLSGSPPPNNVRSDETVATLGTNGRAASAILPWPKDVRGARVEDIGWYRIGYRLVLDENRYILGAYSGAIV